MSLLFETKAGHVANRIKKTWVGILDLTFEEWAKARFAMYIDGIIRHDEIKMHQWVAACPSHVHKVASRAIDLMNDDKPKPHKVKP